MAALYGVISDGAVYYDDGEGLIWIVDGAEFAALGFDPGDISWGDTLPYVAANPYQASDNPPGDAPPPQENPVGGNPPPEQPAPPPAPVSAPAPSQAGLPIWLGLPGPNGPGSAGSPIYLLQNGVYDYVPDADTFAALGGTLATVTWLSALPAAQGPDIVSADEATVPPPSLQFSLFEAAGASVNYPYDLPSVSHGKPTAKGAWGSLMTALSDHLEQGALTASTVAKTLGQAVS